MSATPVLVRRVNERMIHSIKKTLISTHNPMSTPSTVKPIPEGMHTVTPHLVCAGGVAAIEFYKKAFGAVQKSCLLSPDGKVMNAQIQIGDSLVMLHDESPQWGALGPAALGGTPVTIHLYVPDADATAATAVAAGAKVKLPVQDMFWGDRYGVFLDPFGHQWSIATHIRDLTHEEIIEAAKTACGGDGE